MSYVNRIENIINSFSPKRNGDWSSELVLTITELVKLLNEVKQDKGIESLIYHGACYKVLSFSLQYLCAPLTNMPPQVLIIGIEGLDYGNNLYIPYGQDEQIAYNYQKIEDEHLVTVT